MSIHKQHLMTNSDLSFTKCGVFPIVNDWPNPWCQSRLPEQSLGQQVVPELRAPVNYASIPAAPTRLRKTSVRAVYSRRIPTTRHFSPSKKNNARVARNTRTRTSVCFLMYLFETNASESNLAMKSLVLRRRFANQEALIRYDHCFPILHLLNIQLIWNVNFNRYTNKVCYRIVPQ